jgi:hypothetical protein
LLFVLFFRNDYIDPDFFHSVNADYNNQSNSNYFSYYNYEYEYDFEYNFSDSKITILKKKYDIPQNISEGNYIKFFNFLKIILFFCFYLLQDELSIQNNPHNIDIEIS